jgi:hypothetical protein
MMTRIHELEIKQATKKKAEGMKQDGKGGKMTSP